METPQLSHAPNTNHHSSVDTSRPFRSVKEAVAIFGERLLAGELHSPKPFYYKHESPPRTPQAIIRYDDRELKDNENGEKHGLVSTVKKLEAELEETKVELRLLKERESETEVALASLNAELHKNMSRMAQAEAAAAAKAVALRRREGPSPTLAQILSLSERPGRRNQKERQKKMKKKPIIPLVSDLFSWKKGPSTTLHNPLYPASQLYL
ncbi:WEB family protein At1g75720 [Vitis riparia]|uniref:WEB family protein n=1 Tax=Vitis vinifera TaxID=29760 RepID=A0A438GFF9_VITVI|nr:WEB family protein At1g75720 [Vitis riparia]RVW70930.1 hypothetical protein CK203_050582 [Vitis vinifera]